MQNPNTEYGARCETRYHLAARTMESEVEAVLATFLETGTLPQCDDVKALVERVVPEVPHLAVPIIDLSAYDDLLEQLEEVSS